MNRSVPQNLFKTVDKVKVTFENSYLVISRESSFIIVPVNYDIKKEPVYFPMFKLLLVNTPFILKQIQEWYV